MRLFHTPTSPFVRKVMVVAHEAGLADQIETVFLRPVPTQADPTLSRANPLNKIPALVLGDGEVIYDSPVICEYLDGLHGGERLIPASGAARWRALRTQALCAGILDAGILVFYERHSRPQHLHWEPWIEGQATKARQGLDALEEAAAGFNEAVDIGQICAAVTVGWLEFRGVLGDVRSGRPRLAAWYDAFARRPSMVATAPHT